MNELPLPIWFFLLYPLCWIVLFPVLTLWSSLLCLAASRFDRNSLPPVLPRRPWLRLGVLAWVCHVGAAGCTPVSYTHLDVYKRQAPPNA